MHHASPSSGSWKRARTTFPSCWIFFLGVSPFLREEVLQKKCFSFIKTTKQTIKKKKKKFNCKYKLKKKYHKKKKRYKYIHLDPDEGGVRFWGTAGGGVAKGGGTGRGGVWAWGAPPSAPAGW